MAKVYGDLNNILGGPQCLVQYMMLPETAYEKLAEPSATAVQGLQPKINVWETAPGRVLHHYTTSNR